jgi:DNA-binding transcriptional LysR family regulator
MHPGTKYLDTFLAAVETGSFVRAAERLHVTQSTVSYQIKQLETWLGAPLFERTGRRVLPTALGERLAGVCSRFMGELNALKSGAQTGTTAERPVLRIATGSSFGRYVLTPILREPAFEHAVIDLRFGTDEQVWSSVANGQADVGFAYTVGASNALNFDLVYTYPLVLIASAQTPGKIPSSKSGNERIADWISASTFITYDDYEATFARWFENNLGRMPRQLRTTGHCTEIEEAIALVAAGRGLSIVPGHALSAALKARTVRELVLKDKPATTDTVFHVSRLGSFQDAAVDALLAQIAHKWQ